MVSEFFHEIGGRGMLDVLALQNSIPGIGSGCSISMRDEVAHRRSE